MDATSGAGTAHSSEAPDFTKDFSGVRLYKYFEKINHT